MGKKEANNSWLTDELVVYAMQTAYHYARKYNGVPLEDKKDFQQDALAKLVRVANKYNPQKGSPKTFISAVLKNALVDCLRKHYRRTGRMDYLDQIDAIGTEDGEDIIDKIDCYIVNPIANKVAKMLHNGNNTYEVAREMNWKVRDASKFKQALFVALKKAVKDNEPVTTMEIPKGKSNKSNDKRAISN